MRRSEINAAIRRALAHPDCPGLPKWAHWTPSEWQDAPRDDVFWAPQKYSNIRDAGLGWIVTDIGSGDFAKVGATIFVVHNSLLDPSGTPVPFCSKHYAQKFIWLDVGQVLPWHYHLAKTEDIGQFSHSNGYVRGAVQLACADVHEQSLKEEEVSFYLDGVLSEVQGSQSIISLERGMSLTLTTGLAHQFSVTCLEGADTYPGAVIFQEVSEPNNDNTDNYFPTLGHSPSRTPIEEDEPDYYVLVGEYPRHSAPCRQRDTTGSGDRIIKHPTPTVTRNDTTGGDQRIVHCLRPASTSDTTGGGGQSFVVENDGVLPQPPTT